MPILTSAQIAAYAKQAGFPDITLVTAVAVALAESSGRTDVINSIGCVGLWQINQPVHVKTHPEWTREYLQNPANNARAAFVLSDGGTNWRPWEVYLTGVYAYKLSEAREGVGNMRGGPPLSADEYSPVPNLNPLDGIEQLGNTLTDPNNWRRLGFILAGGILVLYGIYVLTGTKDVVKATADTVAKLGVTVATKGKI